MTRQLTRGLTTKDRIKALSFPNENGCWIWQASRTATGYGQITAAGTTKKAHRVAYEAFKGPIPDGKLLDHLCRTPLCVNPDHLEPVDHAENARRGYWGLITKCPKGHPYEGTNLYRTPRGHRRCMACARLYDQTRTPRKKHERQLLALD